MAVNRIEAEVVLLRYDVIYPHGPQNRVQEANGV